MKVVSKYGPLVIGDSGLCKCNARTCGYLRLHVRKQLSVSPEGSPSHMLRANVLKMRMLQGVVDVCLEIVLSFMTASVSKFPSTSLSVALTAELLSPLSTNTLITFGNLKHRREILLSLHTYVCYIDIFDLLCKVRLQKEKQQLSNWVFYLFWSFEMVQTNRDSSSTRASGDGLTLWFKDKSVSN